MSIRFTHVDDDGDIFVIDGSEDEYVFMVSEEDGHRAAVLDSDAIARLAAVLEKEMQQTITQKLRKLQREAAIDWRSHEDEHYRYERRGEAIAYGKIATLIENKI